MKSIFALAVCALLAMNNVIGQQADDILGVWYNQEKTAKIQIYKSNAKYFGKIVWLKEPMRDGKPKLDKENEEESLRTRPVMGLVILKDFEFDEDEWEDGTIYDPKNGETYSCYITKEGDVLHVRGYIGFSWIGRTADWTKAE